jgi:hypothetical protein
MTIRSTLAFIAITSFISVAMNIAPHGASVRAQVAAPIGKKAPQSQYTSFATAGIKLIRPNGFDVAENFNGFQQASTQSSVMVMTIPGPFSEVSRDFTLQGLKTQGMKLKSTQNVSIDGNKGILINLNKTAYGTKFSKWIFTFGDETETKIIIATFPQAKAAKLSPILKSVLLTAKNDTSVPPALGSDVGFKIVANKLTLTRSIEKTLMYTKDGMIPAKSPEDPLFIVAPSLSELAIADKKEFATQRLAQTKSIQINSITSTAPITIDGLDGYEIVADAKDLTSDTPITVYQVMLFDAPSYVLIQSFVGTKIADEYLPEFKAMARSFTKKRK